MTEIPEHLRGRPVSASTYKNHGCRCNGCRAAATEYMASLRRRTGYRVAKVEHWATTRAATWVRHNHPEVWERLVADGYEALRLVRHQPGRSTTGARS